MPCSNPKSLGWCAHPIFSLSWGGALPRTRRLFSRRACRSLSLARIPRRVFSRPQHPLTHDTAHTRRLYLSLPFLSSQTQNNKQVVQRPPSHRAIQTVHLHHRPQRCVACLGGRRCMCITPRETRNEPVCTTLLWLSHLSSSPSCSLPSTFFPSNLGTPPHLFYLLLASTPISSLLIPSPSPDNNNNNNYNNNDDDDDDKPT